MNFRFWEHKENPAGRVIVLGLRMDTPGELKHDDYKTLAHQTYERNSTVYSCVNVIARSCAPVPWVLMDLGTTPTGKAKRYMTKSTYRASRVRSFDIQRFPALGKSLAQTEVVEHPLLKLIEQPNGTQAQAEFFEQFFSYWLIAGNGYLNFLTTSLSGGVPKEMWNLRPDRMNITPQKNGNDVEQLGMVAGYVYKVNQDRNTWQNFEPKSIIHLKFFSPTDDWYGMSPLQAAQRNWQTSNLMTDWNYALVKQGARPSGALVVPTTVSDDVYERLKQEIEESYGGSVNAGRPLFLQGGAKWEQMGLTPLELDYLAGMRDAENKICRVYHVPPAVLGDDSARAYNAYPEARAAFWHEANIPLLDRLRDMLNQRLVPLYGDRFYLDYDRDQIEAIQEDQTRRWTRLNAAKSLTTNEKRIAMGYETFSDPLADTPEFLVNPTPGATGLGPGPASVVGKSVRRLERDEKNLVTHIIDEVEELSLEERAQLTEFIQIKDRRLSVKQMHLQRDLKNLMSRNFNLTGKELAAYLRQAIARMER